MYGYTDLKPTIAITKTNVECPVMGCTEAVQRQRRGDTLRQSCFRCPKHKIFITPSTFEYASDTDNMLWKAPDDLHLWEQIKRVKRVNKVSSDNSEDAVTWNVFRYIEKHGLLGQFVNAVTGANVAKSPQLVYWSYCQNTRQAWQPLISAAQSFGESTARRSEPDLIVVDKDILLFIEAKVGAKNHTPRKATDPCKKYPTGCNGWYSKVFQPISTYEKVAVVESKYELMRLWLIGSWIGSSQAKPFVLVNLVRDGCNYEQDIEARFGKHLEMTPQRRFMRRTWEWIINEIACGRAGETDADTLIRYMKNKTLGYRKTPQHCGELGRAFTL